MANISTLGQSMRLVEHLNTQQSLFSELSTQLATGKKTQVYSGLGTDALTSVRSQTALSSIEVYLTNITRADNTIELSLQAIEEYQAQTGEFSSTLTTFIQQGDHQTGDAVVYDDPATDEIESITVGNTSAAMDVDFNSVVAHATNLFDFLGELLNAQEGDRYLFAGADSSERPFTDDGTLDAAVSTLLTNWKNGTITTDELIADITDGTALNGNANAITDSTVGYSASLSNDNAGKVFVRASENSEFDYTTHANEDSLRNIMVALAVIKNENLPPIVDVYEDGTYPGVPDAVGAPGTTASEQQDSFYELYNALVGMVNESIDGIDQIRFRMETVRVQMDRTKQGHTDQQNLLNSTIEDIENVDVNQVAVKLSNLQTQLEASYRITSITQDLTLVNFLR